MEATTTLSLEVEVLRPVMVTSTSIMAIWEETNHCPHSLYTVAVVTIANGTFTFSIAHGILASLAFVIFFPMGSMLIRLASFPGLWLVHGLFQIFASVVYIAAFALGVWMTQQAPSQVDLIGRYHPIIGIVLFVVLFIQPVLGLLHHFRFKKVGRRTFWSYGHLCKQHTRCTVTTSLWKEGSFLAHPKRAQGIRPPC